LPGGRRCRRAFSAAISYVAGLWGTDDPSAWILMVTSLATLGERTPSSLVWSNSARTRSWVACRRPCMPSSGRRLAAALPPILCPAGHVWRVLAVRRQTRRRLRGRRRCTWELTPPLLFPLAVFHPPSGIRGFSPLGFFDRMARNGDGFRRSGGFSGLGVPQWVGGGGLHVLPLGSSRFVILFRSLLGVFSLRLCRALWGPVLRVDLSLVACVGAPAFSLLTAPMWLVLGPGGLGRAC
jgi:hypothetical protein